MFENIIGRSQAMTEVLDIVAKVAPSDTTVLIFGETGTGKELIANAIHENSPRKSGPFVKINCAAIPENLLESELFGHEKGAFTDANRRKLGKFELAQGGSIFLDEISEMSVAMQAKLLRVLQEREFNRVGGNENIKIDIRVIAATNRDLAQNVKTATFREDLYYRLKGVCIELPPLRKNKEDIPPIANHYLKVFSEKNNKNILSFTSQAMEKLKGYDWPGNVRELIQAVERSVVLSQSDQIGVEELLLMEKSQKSTEPMTSKASIRDSEYLNAQKYKELCDLILKEKSPISKDNVQAFLKRIADPLKIWPTDRHGVAGLGRELYKAFKNYPEIFFRDFDSAKTEKIFRCFRQNASFDKENGDNIENLLKSLKDQSLPPSSILLIESKAPETFETRKEAAGKLADFLKDNNKRLVVVAAPFGWGKDVIMRQALSQCGCPPHQTINLVNINNIRRLTEKLLGSKSVTNEELFNAEEDFDYALDLINRQFINIYGDPANCLLIFLNGSLNEHKSITKPLIRAIIRLAESNFRCIIELWDPIELDYGQSIRPKNVGFLFTKDMPRLSDEEVDYWLEQRGLTSDEFKKEFRELSGHPLHIRATLDRLFTLQASGEILSRDIISEEALEWLTKEEFIKYEMHVEQAIGGVISPFLLQWSALIKDQHFPQAHLTKEINTQVRRLLELGLAHRNDAGIVPSGWYQFYCLSKIKSGNQENLVLDIDFFSGIEASVKLQISRDLFDLSMNFNVVFSQQLLALARSLLEVDVSHKKELEDVNPASSYFITAISSEASVFLKDQLANIENGPTAEYAIFILEQLCRNRQWDAANNVWSQILDLNIQKYIIGALDNNWRALKTLNRAFYLSSRFGQTKLINLGNLTKIICAVRIGGHGHRYHVVNFLLDIASSLSKQGMMQRAAELIDPIMQELKVIPFNGTYDHRDINLCDLQYRFLILKNITATELRDSADALINALTVVENVLSKMANDQKWQRRYLWCLLQVDDFLFHDNELIFREKKAFILKNMLSSTMFLNYILRFEWPYESSEEAPPVFQKLLWEVIQTVWHRENSSNSKSLFIGNHFALLCGIFHCDQKSIEWAAIELHKYLENKDADNALRNIEDCLYLLTALASVAKRYVAPLNVTGHRRSSLKGYLVEAWTKYKPLISSVRSDILQSFLMAIIRLLSYNIEEQKPLIIGYEDYQDQSIDIHPTHLDSIIKSIVDIAISDGRLSMTPIAKLHMHYLNESWYRRLRIARRYGTKLPKYNKILIKTTLNQYKSEIDNSYILKKYEAEAEQYVWNNKKALNVAEEAYKVATSFKDRTTILRFLLNRIIIPSVFTPISLRTQFILTDDDYLMEKLNLYGNIFLDVNPNERWRNIFLESLANRGNDGFWKLIIKTIDERFPKLEDFWPCVSESAFVDGQGNWEKEIIEDLTDSYRLRMIAQPLRWASELAELSLDIKLSLAEAAIKCCYAAKIWQVGAGIGGDVNATFELACSILLAWEKARELQNCECPVILGETTAPVKGLNDQFLQWPEWTYRLFVTVINPKQTLGRFRAHTATIFDNKVSPLYKSYNNWVKISKAK